MGFSHCSLRRAILYISDPRLERSDNRICDLPGLVWLSNSRRELFVFTRTVFLHERFALIYTVFLPILERVLRLMPRCLGICARAFCMLGSNSSAIVGNLPVSFPFS